MKVFKVKYKDKNYKVSAKDDVEAANKVLAKLKDGVEETSNIDRAKRILSYAKSIEDYCNTIIRGKGSLEATGKSVDEIESSAKVILSQTKGFFY